MQLLRLPAEGALDLRSARGLRYPKNIVGVTHPHSLPGNSPLLCEYRPNRIDSMWWARAYTAMRVGKVQEAPIVRGGRRGTSPCLRSNNGAFRGASFYSRRRGRECVVRKRYVVLP